MLKKTIDKNKIPELVEWVVKRLETAGYETYLVGGSVRDLLLEKIPKDFDLTTSAHPEEIRKIFGEEDTLYENTYGTVGIKIKTKNRDGLEETEIVEVTTFRRESDYNDSRHPDKIEWAKNIEEDLARRDFTINALAYRLQEDKLIDNFGGLEDLEAKIIRTVGDPEKRFTEDALRMLRAVRFAAQLDFIISAETFATVLKLSETLKNISLERVRDEFIKMIMTPRAMQAMIMLEKLQILKFISPELVEAIGVEQNGHHTYDVFEHLLRALNHATEKDYDLTLRLSALFHDIGKPATRRYDKQKGDYTFYGHEVVGARMVEKILTHLKFEKSIVQKVTKLVRYHMFFSDTSEVTLSAVRRLIVKVGEENIWDLIKLRLSDRIGSGTKKEEPYRLRQFEAMIDEALSHKISLKNLKINGEKIMEVLNLKPGKKVGLILNALFEEVIEEPEKNSEEYLIEETKKLSRLSEAELGELAKKGKEKMEDLNEQELEKIKNKFKVK